MTVSGNGLLTWTEVRGVCVLSCERSGFCFQPKCTWPSDGLPNGDLVSVSLTFYGILHPALRRTVIAFAISGRSLVQSVRLPFGTRSTNVQVLSREKKLPRLDDCRTTILEALPRTGESKALLSRRRSSNSDASCRFGGSQHLAHRHR